MQGKLLSSGFKEVIELLKRDYELRRLNGLSNEARNDLIKKTKALIKALMSDINPKGGKFVLPSKWTDTPILINATHLLIYRECLSLSQLSHENYNNDYIQFLAEHPSFQEAIARKNPFMLHEHLLHLGNIMQSIHHMKSGKVAPNRQILKNKENYKKMLEQLQAQIDSLDHNSLGTFKDYLQTLLNYTLYCASEMDVAALHLKETFICARVGALNDAQSGSLAADDDKALQNFYNCGSVLFARAPLKSFQAVQDHIASLGVLSKEALMLSLDEAKSRYSIKSEDSEEQIHSARKRPQSLSKGVS